jgi:anti-anti-sigma regulatory factor
MDFVIEYSQDIIIATVVIRRATFLEALQFQNLLIKEIDNGYRKIVIDLTHCSSIDPAFFSAIFIAYKKLINLNGNLKLIKPKNYFDDIERLENNLRIFEIFNSKEEAIESYKMIFCNPSEETLFDANWQSLADTPLISNDGGDLHY